MDVWRKVEVKEGLETCEILAESDVQRISSQFVWRRRQNGKLGFVCLFKAATPNIYIYFEVKIYPIFAIITYNNKYYLLTVTHYTTLYLSICINCRSNDLCFFSSWHFTFLYNRIQYELFTMNKWERKMHIYSIWKK